jgi:hypothetical protein
MGGRAVCDIAGFKNKLMGVMVYFNRVKINKNQHRESTCGYKIIVRCTMGICDDHTGTNK